MKKEKKNRIVSIIFLTVLVLLLAVYLRKEGYFDTFWSNAISTSKVPEQETDGLLNSETEKGNSLKNFEEYYYPSHNRYSVQKGDVPFPRTDDLVFLRPEDFQTEWKKVVMTQDETDGTPLLTFQILNMEYVDTFGDFPSPHYFSDLFDIFSDDGTLKKTEAHFSRRVYLLNETVEDEVSLDIRLLAVDMEMVNMSKDQTFECRYPLGTTMLFEDSDWGYYYAPQYTLSYDLPFYITPYAEGFPVYYSEGEMLDTEGHFIPIVLKPQETIRFRLGFLIDSNAAKQTYLCRGAMMSPYSYYYSNLGGETIYSIPEFIK